MKRILIFVSVVLILFGGFIFTSEMNHRSLMKLGFEIDTENDRLPIDVSFVELLSNKTEYIGKPVRVIGVCRITYEGDSIYLSKEDYNHSININGFYLYLRNSSNEKNIEALARLNGKYVIVQGIFSDNTGHEGLFAGSIQHIKIFKAWHIP